MAVFHKTLVRATETRSFHIERNPSAGWRTLALANDRLPTNRHAPNGTVSSATWNGSRARSSNCGATAGATPDPPTGSSASLRQQPHHEVWMKAPAKKSRQTHDHPAKGRHHGYPVQPPLVGQRGHREQ